MGLSLSGQDLTATIGRSVGADLTDTITLPNNYVNGVVMALGGQDISVTLERTGGLADLTAIITLPDSGGGLTGVEHDDTLFGDGTTSDPLGGERP